VNILVTDASGKIVHSTYQPVIAGFTQVKLNFNNLATGVYTIAVYTNEGERKTVQFIKK
jgi:TFIIF-interacting CTD phosphatase-like protein